MKAVLAAEIGEHVVVTVTMTKEELAQAGTMPVFLAAAVCDACSGVQGKAAAEESAPVAEEPAPAAVENAADQPAEPFLTDYRALILKDRSGTKENIIDRALDCLIEESVIPVSMEEVEDEAEYELMAVMQKLRYDVMFRGVPAEEVQQDPDELKAEIIQEVIREKKVNYILQYIVEEEQIEVSPEELLEEAQAMARRQGTTLEMVQSFFGEDLHGLIGDVQKRKAKELLYQLAMK